MRPDPRRSPSGDTAKILLLIGLVFQLIGVIVFVGIAALFLIVPILGGILLAFAVLGIVWLVLVYVFAYAPVARGDYGAGKTPTLVFAILSLLTVNLISGVLYLVAYVKIGDAITESQPGPPFWGTPGWTAPTVGGGRFCPGCGAPNPGTGAFCASCGRPLA